MRRSIPVLVTVLLALLAPVATPAATAGTLPGKKVWLADVRTAMSGWRAYVDQRLAEAGPGEHLAVNLDIDNTALETRYSPYDPVPVVLRFTRFAHDHGIAVFFNTGRGPDSSGMIRRALVRAGYAVDRFCHRRSGERLVHGKQRCRASFVAAGYTIVANVGNRSTDFAGGDYERAFRLPSYGNALG
jgi:predicted secreted acid phosphatase